MNMSSQGKQTKASDRFSLKSQLVYKHRETLNILADETSNVFSRENETNEPFIKSMKALRLKITLRIFLFFKSASVEIKCF